MKLLSRQSLALFVFLILVQFSFAQVMNPNDPVVEYTSGNVQQPASGQVGDWVKTSRLSWNTSDYKCYIYKGNIFRLKFPTTYQHNVNDGKVYPVFIFFHGLGESGEENIYDNEYHLLHGGERHKNAVNDGRFDGFLLYMQNQYGFFAAPHFDAVNEIIRNFLVPQNKADINRIYVNGLSAGGAASWEMAIRHPTLVAATLPISAADPSFQNSANILKYIPTWHFQGALDTRPAPGISENLGQSILNVGGSYKYTKYPTRGHSCWNDAWSDPDFYNFMLRAHKANPVPMFGKYEFCVGENVNLTLGLSAGFNGYQWRKNGVVIAGATSNTLLISGTQAATFGTYDCRILRGANIPANWSPWSPAPIVVKLKDPTIPPPIQPKGLVSKVIPSPDGNAGVTLMQPAGYLTYSWTRQGNSTVLGTADTFNTTTPGIYVVKVTEQFGCLSEFSLPFTVVNANGPDKPDAATNVLLTPLSLTQMKVDWSDNPHPNYNETNFEVFQANQPGGPYTLVGITTQDNTSFIVNGLSGGTKYYYVIRAVNNTGAAPLSPEVSGTTLPDNQAPTAPSNLRITASTNNSVSLAWNASVDNYGVQVYDIYINGVKSYVTTGVSFTCYNLTASSAGYSFIVKSRDAANNSSPASNQVQALLPTTVPDAPAVPTNFIATPVSHKQVNLTWTDNSNNETGFQITRSVNPVSGFTSLGILPANTTSFSDSLGMSPSTLYYYRLNAIYQYGGSSLIGNADANWRLNNNYTDASINNKVITASGSPTFNAADKMEGSHALNFNGTSQHVDITTANNDYLRGGYAQKSVVFWMKSASNTGRRVIMDLGGSDDGLSLHLDSNRLYAGVASNNVRANFFVPYTSTDWNHIALVYSGNTLILYINGSEVASTTSLTFTSVGTTTGASRIGFFNGATSFGTLTNPARFSGLIDHISIYASALSVVDVNNLINNVSVSATTGAMPGAPVVPSNLVATGMSSSANQISWNDNSDNELNFELYKSDDNNLNYVLLATLPNNATSFTDSGLFSSAIRYYKIRAINVSGNLGFSNEDSAITLAPVPVVTPIADKYMRIGTQLQVSVMAVSPLNGPITLTPTNLPPFATFTSNGGNGTITFNNPSTQATYPGITITATDPFGSSAVSFQLVVNDNYSPVLAAISNIALDENQTAQLNLSATDQNPADVLSWTFTGLPSFATPVINGGLAQLNLAPGFAHHGTYPVSVLVEDGNHGTTTGSFVITINNINPNQQIYVNFSGPGSPVAPAPWNSTNDMPGLNDNYASLADQSGNTTPIGIRVLSAWGGIGNGSNLLGVNTGNNSGVYPDAVIRSAYWTDVNNTQRMKIYGLDPTRRYTFTFFGSRGNVGDNRTSKYTLVGIDSNSVTLSAANNSQNVAVIQNVQPGLDSFELRLEKGVGSQFAYLNALVIERVFEDSSAPAKPRDITAQMIGTAARLTWVDAAFNETTYEIYRSTDRGGVYNLLNPGGNNPNLQLYNDATVAGNQTYYYAVRAVNANGEAYSDTVSVTTGNGTPAIAPIANVTMRIQEIVDVNISVTDDAGDAIILTATNLPPFATLTDNGDGTGVIHIAPGSSIGIFNNVTVKATDPSGANSSRLFRIVVRDVFNSVYVNFSHTTLHPAPSPWNSFTSVPFTNKSLTNMIDDSEAPTGISITQLDTFEGATDLGATTGDNTGVFPDNVMRTVYYQGSTTPMRLRIAGLNTTNTKYNLVFFASRLAGDNRTTLYIANGDTVSLNAANNTANTVQINGLVPNASGIIEFSCLKSATSPYAYLGALVIQSYLDNGLPSAPSNLVAQAVSKTAIGLTWSDKSSDETGFDIERAEAYDGPYTVIHTTAPDVTSYVNNSGLVANTINYYRVRARKDSVYSNYTNIASTSTYHYSVSINFNRQNNASSPWNNTSRAPEEGRVFSNLRNELNNQTGINMTIVDNFNGDNPSGMITGNNSGVYPDNVLRSSWWVDAGYTAKLKISNLNQTLSYSFVFTGSRNGGGDRTSVYTINNKSVSLNASFNTTQTVQLNNVRPDENGEVFVSVSLAQYAMFAYLNAMIINAYSVGEDPNSPATEQQRVANEFVVTGITTEANDANDANQLSRNINPGLNPAQLFTKSGVYPNPFKNQVTVSANFEKSQDKVRLTLLDLSGKVIHIQNIGYVPKGTWNQKLDLSGKTLKPGVYILQIGGSDKKIPPAIFKLVKTQ